MGQEAVGAMRSDFVDLANALAALKFKRGARFVGTNAGTEIHQPGKPVLLLTPEAARRYAQERAEAEAEGHL